MQRIDHLEISEGDTKLASSCSCPLKADEIIPNQLFGSDKLVMCMIQGQALSDRSFQIFVCPYFYGAVYPSKYLIDCRHPDSKNK